MRNFQSQIAFPSAPVISIEFENRKGVQRSTAPFLAEQRQSEQGFAKRRSPGLVNFVAAAAHHFFLALPAAFTQPGDRLLAEPCTVLLSNSSFSAQLR